MSLKWPRHRLSIDVSFDEYLALLWAIDHRKLHGERRAQKQTVSKIAAFEAVFLAEYDAWKKANFACARKRKTA